MAIAAQRHASQPTADLAGFSRYGYTVVEDLLAPTEVEELREIAGAAIAGLAAQGLATAEQGEEGTLRASTCDLLSIPSLRHVPLDPRLLGAIGQLLGGPPCYFGDSSVRVGKTGDRAWHRDNVDRVRWRGGPDWQDPYPLLRCGLYLQDQARHSGGLALRPGSNRPGRRLPTLPRLVSAKAGDLVVWDLRIVHSGEAIRPRGLPWMALNPRLQTRLPESLRMPDERERVVMFMTFGLAGPHLDNYLAYLRTRDYMRRSWRNSRFGPETWELAQRAGLTVLHATPEYGTPEHGTPQYATPEHATPEHGTPEHGTPEYGTPEYGTPQYGTPTGPA